MFSIASAKRGKLSKEQDSVLQTMQNSQKFPMIQAHNYKESETAFKSPWSPRNE